MDCDIIMAVLVDKRTDVAPRVQEILTEYGCIIDTRLGLHQTRDCSDDGLIILHLCDDEQDRIADLEVELEQLEGVAVNKMEISL